MKDLLITKYFEGTLSSSEQQQFSDLLITDPEFKADFEFEKDLQQATILEKKEDLKKAFKNIESSEGTEHKNSNIKYVKLAIAACLLIAAGWLGYQTANDSNLSNQQLYASNFEPYRNIIAPITRGEEIQTTEEIAFATYERKEYQKAISLFDTLYASKKYNYLLFYKGNAYLALGNIDKAITSFETHQKTVDEFAAKSKWYLALAYLKKEEIEKAKELFIEIDTNETYNYKKAKRILEKL